MKLQGFSLALARARNWPECLAGRPTLGRLHSPNTRRDGFLSVIRATTTFVAMRGQGPSHQGCESRIQECFGYRAKTGMDSPVARDSEHTTPGRLPRRPLRSIDGDG